MSTTSLVTFYDEINRFDNEGNLLGSAANPLPVGVFTMLYGGNSVTPEAYSGNSGYITLGGQLSVAALQPNQLYTAVFSGAQAPQVYGQFTTDSSGNADSSNLLPGQPGAPCSVIGYRSPALSSLGYAIEETNLWPVGWFSQQAKTNGGNAFAVAAGLGNILGSLDYMSQALLAMQRLPTSIGADYSLLTEFDGGGSYDSGIGYFDAEYAADALDSWAFDFLGNLWTRQPGMSDVQWFTLIQQILQTPKCTLAGIQQILTAWELWYGAAISASASEAMGLDEGAGTVSGMDLPAPPAAGSTVTYMDTAPGASGLTGRQIVVFDSQTMASPNPSGGAPILAESAYNAYLPTPLVPGAICVYFRNPNSPDSGITPVSVTNLLLLKIVQNWKAAGINFISSGTLYPALFAEN